MIPCWASQNIRKCGVTQFWQADFWLQWYSRFIRFMYMENLPVAYNSNFYLKDRQEFLLVPIMARKVVHDHNSAPGQLGIFTILRLQVYPCCLQFSSGGTAGTVFKIQGHRVPNILWRQKNKKKKIRETLVSNFYMCFCTKNTKGSILSQIWLFK